MPEGLTEVTHHLVRRRSTPAGRRRREELLEIFEAVLLATVAVVTAVSGYQTARWDARHAGLYALSTKSRALATQASTRSGQERLYDNAAFSSWLQAREAGSAKVAHFFRRRFRPEFALAFRAWLLTMPFTNRHAPPGPLFMRQYHSASAGVATEANARASELFDEGSRALDTGDKYLRNTVLLSTVLFITAIAPRFKTNGVRLSLLGVSTALLAVALYFFATLPKA